jgi:putative Mg2+ transporter-C (MgtC) family protein
MAGYLLRILVAGVIGYWIGIICNQEINTKSKRVYALISIGAALLTITGIGMMQGMKLPIAGDPARIPSQVISALGFLGTGMIWVTEDRQVVGITSAASLWLTAIVGMMIGLGLTSPTGIGVLFFIAIFWSSRRLGKYNLRKFFGR